MSKLRGITSLIAVVIFAIGALIDAYGHQLGWALCEVAIAGYALWDFDREKNS